MKLKKGSIALLTLAGMFYMSVQKADACTRAVYIGPDNMVITGRTMDWKEDIMSNIYVFPRGIQRAGYNKENAVKWTSKYGSVIATGYDIGTCDGMNEKGLVASLLFLPESVFDRQGDTRPVMGISIWTQYVLDNFATVHEAVEELKKESFRIDAPHMPNGSASTLHLAITDETGNTAVLEYLDGNLSIHEGKEFQVMTNSPRYDYQLAINDYWKEIGGLQMLPGTNRSSDRFVRASFYIHAIPQTPDAKIAVPSVLSVMRNVSVPFGITTPDKPHISSTRWRSVSDQKNKIYYFESVMTPNLFWLDLKKIDFGSKDVLVGIAASGRTPYVLGAMNYARKQGAHVIGISCNPGSQVEKTAEIAITPTPGPEVVTGSTRMKSGTAQKMVLNMLSTGAMIKLGKVYGNLMVDVKPTNAKLVERCKRIVCEATGVDYDTATEALEKCGYRAKVAIVMLKTGSDVHEAEQRLEAHEGRVAQAVGEN